MQTGWDEIHQEGGAESLLISLTSLGRLKGVEGSLLPRLDVAQNCSVAPTSNLP